MPGINLSGLKCCCVKIIRYQEQHSFSAKSSSAVESGVDMALPCSVQGAKSGAETHMAMNFFLSKQGCGTS